METTWPSAEFRQLFPSRILSNFRWGATMLFLVMFQLFYQLTHAFMLLQSINLHADNVTSYLRLVIGIITLPLWLSVVVKSVRRLDVRVSSLCRVAITRLGPTLIQLKTSSDSTLFQFSGSWSSVQGKRHQPVPPYADMNYWIIRTKQSCCDYVFDRSTSDGRVD